MANSESFNATTRGDREILLTRLFDAPPSLVFEAMSKPEHVRRWWGILGDEYSVTVCEIELKVGGKWRFAGRGPRGDYGFHGEYREIEVARRVVFTEIFDPYPDTVSVVTSVFSEEGKKTRLTVSCVYPTLEVRDMVLGTGMARGAGISYDRLEDVVRELQGT